MKKPQNSPKYVICYSENGFFGTPYHVYEYESVRRGALRPDMAMDESEFLAFAAECAKKGHTMVSNVGHHSGLDEETCTEIVRRFKGLGVS